MLNEKDVEMIASAGEQLAEATDKLKATKKPKAGNKPKTDKKPKAKKKPSDGDNADKEVDRGDRRHTIITYIEPKYLKPFLNSASWVQHWAYCYHDQDTWTPADEKENDNHKAGTPKTPHTHIVLYTYDCKTSSAICKLFKRYSIEVYGKDNAQNTRSEYCDIYKQFRYLIHADDPEKHPYSVTDRVVDDLVYWDKFSKGEADKPNSGYNMIVDLLADTPYRTMCMRYGKEFIYHAKYLEDCAQKIRIEENVGNSPINDDLISVVLDASPFGVLQKDDFFKMINYLREVFHNEFCNPYGFEIYLKKLGLGDKKNVC